MLPLYLIQRGNNRQICFAGDEDLKASAIWVYKGSVTDRSAESAQGLYFAVDSVAGGNETAANNSWVVKASGFSLNVDVPAWFH